MTQSRVIYCVIINQLATPGLGSLIGRRYLVGSFQLTIALVGCVLLMSWMVRYFWGLTLQQAGEPAPTGSYGWMAKWGGICFGLAWSWALVTSLSLLREAKDS